MTLAIALAGCSCTTKNPAFCENNSDCTSASAPFCDVSGQFGDRNTCTAEPIVDAGDPDGPVVSIDASIVDANTPVDADIADAALVDDASVPDASPPTDAGTVVNVLHIAAGGFHTCALIEGGTVRCWGLSARGQLGYGNTNTIGDDEAPTDSVDIGGGTVSQLVTGEQHTCALIEGGTVRCWGHAGFGQLGYGNTEDIGDNETPASAGDVPLGGTALELAAGNKHTCALIQGGTVRCWGDSEFGQLGQANTDTIGDNETPSSVAVVPLGATATRISAGHFHTCAVLATGAVRCWGRGSLGRLGYGNTNNIGDNETPSSAGNVDVTTTPIATTAAGGQHTCVRLTTGGVRCWGTAGNGQLGYGNAASIGDDELPSTAGSVNVGGGVAELASGASFTCARFGTGGVRCWGHGGFGQLGYGNTEDIGEDESPDAAGDVPIGAAVEQLALGHVHACALLSTGAVRCWGQGTFGRLGYGNTANIGDNETPAAAGNVPLF